MHGAEKRFACVTPNDSAAQGGKMGSTPDTNDLIEQLDKLAKLHAENALSDEEYKAVIGTETPVKTAPTNAADYAISISWKNRDDYWNGMVLTNVGEKPVEIASIMFNSQDRCTVQPFTIADLSTGLNGVAPQMKSLIIDQLKSGSYGSGSVFVDPKVIGQYAPSAKTKSVILQVGD